MTTNLFGFDADAAVAGIDHSDPEARMNATVGAYTTYLSGLVRDALAAAQLVSTETTTRTVSGVDIPTSTTTTTSRTYRLASPLVWDESISGSILYVADELTVTTVSGGDEADDVSVHAMACRATQQGTPHASSTPRDTGLYLPGGWASDILPAAE